MSTELTVAEQAKQIRHRLNRAVDQTTYHIYHEAELRKLLSELDELEIKLYFVNEFGKFFNLLRKKVKTSHKDIANTLKVIVAKWLAHVKENPQQQPDSKNDSKNSKSKKNKHVPIDPGQSPAARPIKEIEAEKAALKQEALKREALIKEKEARRVEKERLKVEKLKQESELRNGSCEPQRKRIKIEKPVVEYPKIIKSESKIDENVQNQNKHNSKVQNGANIENSVTTNGFYNGRVPTPPNQNHPSAPPKLSVKIKLLGKTRTSPSIQNLTQNSITNHASNAHSPSASNTQFTPQLNQQLKTQLKPQLKPQLNATIPLPIASLQTGSSASAQSPLPLHSKTNNPSPLDAVKTAHVMARSPSPALSVASSNCSSVDGVKKSKKSKKDKKKKKSSKDGKRSRSRTPTEMLGGGSSDRSSVTVELKNW